jgi:hypothetical protein
VTAAAARAEARASPLRAILTAIDGGARTVADVRASTGLDTAVIDAAVDHLVRARRLSVIRMRNLCSGRCKDCPVVSSCGDRPPNPPAPLDERHKGV